MKTLNVVRLDRWIQDNKGLLESSERGTLTECAKKAAEQLGFKVPSSSLSELMRNHGIETRRMSARQCKELVMLGEIEKLTAENMQLRRILAKVAASEYIPEDIREFIFAGLPDEIKEAVFAKAEERSKRR